MLIRIEWLGLALSIELARLEPLEDDAPAATGPAESIPTPMTTYADRPADPLVFHAGGLEGWGAEDRRRSHTLGFH